MPLPLLLSFLACADPPAITPTASTFETEAAPAPPPAYREPPGWNSPAGSTVADAFPPPDGAIRVATDAYGDTLRHLKLRAPNAAVYTFDDRVVHGHSARVIDLPLVKGDLQQCADSIIRLRAEYLRDSGAEISFHATSGDPIPWERYRNGERAYAVGNSLKWKAAKPASWDGYLSAVFTWAGTASMEQFETRADTAPQAGDMLIQGGFPGHAVVLLDVAKRGDTTFVLVGEGYTPAQDFHVEMGPVGGWWDWKDGVALPHWPMPRGALRSWKK